MKPNPQPTLEMETEVRFNFEFTEGSHGRPVRKLIRNEKGEYVNSRYATVEDLKSFLAEEIERERSKHREYCNCDSCNFESLETPIHKEVVNEK